MMTLGDERGEECTSEIRQRRDANVSETEFATRTTKIDEEKKVKDGGGEIQPIGSSESI